MEIVIFFGIGFFAQLIDGALGMAFGAISTTALLSFGLSPLHASAIVHTAEVVTTGASSAAHIVQKNLTRKLVIELALAGSVGAIIGAYVLSHVDGQTIRLFVAAYLLLIGLSILLRALRALHHAILRRLSLSRSVSLVAFWTRSVVEVGER
jgi:Predicted permeases